MLSISLVLLGGCKDDGVVDTGEVLEAPRLATIDLNTDAGLLTEVGDDIQFHGQGYDQYGQPFDAPVTFRTDDPDVEVSADGTVTAVASVGSAQVWAESDGVRSVPAFVLIAPLVEDDAVLVTDDQYVGMEVLAAEPNVVGSHPVLPRWCGCLRRAGSLGA